VRELCEKGRRDPQTRAPLIAKLWPADRPWPRPSPSMTAPARAFKWPYSAHSAGPGVSPRLLWGPLRPVTCASGSTRFQRGARSLPRGGQRTCGATEAMTALRPSSPLRGVALLLQTGRTFEGRLWPHRGDSGRFECAAQKAASRPLPPVPTMAAVLESGRQAAEPLSATTVRQRSLA
jgi:hypothetical protein